MLRKSLFWGLTLMLGAVLVWLIINGRKEEARQAAAPTEIVQTARLSPTRVVAPKDLAIVASNALGAIKTGKSEPIGPIEIRNNGRIAYHAVMLRLACLDSNGKVLDTKSRLVPDTIQPGQSLTVSDFAPENVPAQAVRYRISIAYSNLGPAPG
jgi:hypothetical protein